MTVLANRRTDLTLLAYLARRAPRSATRAELAALLWEDRAETRARQSLRQGLVDLKRLVGAALLLDGDSVRLEPGLRLDAREFEEELARGNPAAAVLWWHGDFLAGMDDVGGESFRGKPVAASNCPSEFRHCTSMSRDPEVTRAHSARACASTTRAESSCSSKM
ncbi:MAG: hypothetical protein ABJC36_09620 [Gemmatimonadales bacterium]